MESCPIPHPSDDQRTVAAHSVKRIIEISKQISQTVSDVLEWLRVEHGVSEPTAKLRSLLSLDCDAFVGEIRKVRGRKNPLSLAAFRNLRDEHSNHPTSPSFIVRSLVSGTHA